MDKVKRYIFDIPNSNYVTRVSEDGSKFPVETGETDEPMVTISDYLKLENRYEELKKILKKYGEHSQECPCKTTNGVSSRYCICGFDEATANL